MYAEEGLGGFYSGYAVALTKTIPMALLQFIFFQNLKFITDHQDKQ